MTENITQYVNECFFLKKNLFAFNTGLPSFKFLQEDAQRWRREANWQWARFIFLPPIFCEGGYPCSLPPPWFLHLCYLLIIAKTNSAFSFCGRNNSRLCNGTQKFDEKYTFQVSSVKRIHPNKQKVLEELPVDENEGFCGSSCTVNLLQQPGLCLLSWISECGIFSFVTTIWLWHSLN